MKGGFTVVVVLLLHAAGMFSEATSVAYDCNYYGTGYRKGDQFDDVISCNTCTCEEGDFVSCTEMYCPKCYYNKISYNIGDNFTSIDGCNTCVCTNSGNVGCTKKACKKECPLFKCVPCKTGYVIDEDGCQTCECRDYSCEYVSCPENTYCSNSHCCPYKVLAMFCLPPCEHKQCGIFQYCSSYCNCFAKCKWFWEW